MDDADLTRVVAWAREMRTVHARLREALALTREAHAGDGDAPSGADAAADRDLLLHCWGFCLALTGHHRGEDDVLFPGLLREHPHLADIVASLTRDHHVLDHLVGAYRRALDADADPTELERHLDGVDALMESHFRFEERTLLPLLEDLTLHARPSDALGPLVE